jgi:glycosyltransferase involved in cell wall biosynthesis
MAANPGDGVLVLGGGNAEPAGDGRWATKSAIARYLHDLADELGRVTWLVHGSGTWGVDLAPGQHTLEGVLDAERVRVEPFEYRMRRVPSLWRQLLRVAPGHRYGMYFLPAAVPFAPLVRLASRDMERTASYLAGDYVSDDVPIEEGRWPGWAMLQRRGHVQVIRACDVGIARGRKLADAARRYCSDVHETIPLANIDFARARDADPGRREAGRVLFVGVVAESKGVGVLLECLRRLDAAGRRVSLELCGDGPDLARYREEATRLGAARDAIRFLGWVDDAARLDTAFAEASLLVMPSTTHPEGVPRVIDEAIARGLPVASTSAGGVAEEFTRGEIEIVEPGDADALTAAMDRLLFEPEARAASIERASARRDWLLDSGTAGVQHARLLRGGGA